MELESYGPIDRLFEVRLPASPVEVPQLEAGTDAPGFTFTGWHWVAFVGVLGLAGFTIWKIKQSNNEKHS